MRRDDENCQKGMDSYFKNSIFFLKERYRTLSCDKPEKMNQFISHECFIMEGLFLLERVLHYLHNYDMCKTRHKRCLFFSSIIHKLTIVCKTQMERKRLPVPVSLFWDQVLLQGFLLN